MFGACGGSDAPTSADLPTANSSADDAATSGLAPDDPVDADGPAVSGEAPDGSSTGDAYSGGVVAENFDGICDILDDTKVAELFAIEPTSVVSSVNTGTGVC